MSGFVPDVENAPGCVHWYRRTDGVVCRVEVTEFYWGRGYTVHNQPARAEDIEAIGRVLNEQATKGTK